MYENITGSIYNDPGFTPRSNPRGRSRGDFRAAPYILYRFYAADGALLYIGITRTATQRFAAHAKDKSWWSEVTTIRIEHYPDQDSAATAEKRAIKSEYPIYNKIHNGGPRGYRAPFDPMRELGVVSQQLRDVSHHKDIAEQRAHAEHEKWVSAMRDNDELRRQLEHQNYQIRAYQDGWEKARQRGEVGRDPTRKWWRFWD